MLSSLVITGYQIFQHLRYQTVKDEQVWIVRILFIVPIYGLCSWLGLVIPDSSVYFDAVRGCYEAFVIYSFMRLCMAYVGGETAILAEINGTPVHRSCMSGTCCCVKMTYSVRFLRLCQQMVLQFCAIKPVAAVATIILEAVDLYHEGEWSFTHGYIYIAAVYNVSVSTALYGLVLFYNATRGLLSSYHPILKFFSIKSIVFLSFWQGILLNILYWTKLIDTTSSYQSFLICIEMLLAAILLQFAFPYRGYRDRKEKGIQLQQIGSHFKDTLNPQDVVSDAIHNFSRVYQEYAQQGKVDEEEVKKDEMMGLSLEQDKVTAETDQPKHSDPSSSPGNVSKEIPNFKEFLHRGRTQADKYKEKVTLLGEDSDEDDL